MFSVEYYELLVNALPFINIFALFSTNHHHASVRIELTAQP